MNMPSAFQRASIVLAVVVLAGCTSAPPSFGTVAPPPAGTAAVTMKDAAFQPASLTVSPGTTVTWTNADPFAHTVTPADTAQWGTPGAGKAGDEASWLQAGATWSFTFAKAGTFTYYCIPHSSRDADGMWHGMTGTIVVTSAGGAAAIPNMTVVPSPVAVPRMLPDADGVVRIGLVAQEVPAQLADGVGYTFWTFGGTVPGPMLRVREGDTVEVRLTNPASSQHPHSIDLHAVNGPGGGAALTQTGPGNTTAFQFQALNPGLYVYHCATAHVPTHVANGMYGMILVEPKAGLPPVDREYYLMQGEVYADGKPGQQGMLGFDAAKMEAGTPSYVLLNGRVGAVTGPGALHAHVNDTVRLYFGVGTFLPASFHVIGEVFDRVWPEGGSPPVTNVQTTLVPAGGAVMTEFRVEVPGTYLLVDHTLMRSIDHGGAGQLVVDGAGDPAVYHAVP